MNTAIYPIRTQISLSTDLKRLIEASRTRLNESLSEYLRRAAILRMMLEDREKNDLQTVAMAVIGNVAKSKSGWNQVKNISSWQKQERRNEDRHRT
ncbi:MAG: hypothetical protein AAB973_03935 [Patescibacteria group bacterium]